MTPEQLLWQRVKRTLSHCYPYSSHLVRVENALDPGTPDISWAIDRWTGDPSPGVRAPSYQEAAEGWLELKVASLPLVPTSTVQVRAGPAQRVWWNNRIRTGGRVHILLWLRRKPVRSTIEDEHLLFTGEVAAELFTPLQRAYTKVKEPREEHARALAQFRLRAVARWGPKLDRKTLIQGLTGWRE